MNTLYVDCATGTFADELLTFGLARVVADMLSRSSEIRHSVRIMLAGSHYALQCEPSFTPDAISRAAKQGPYAPIVFLRTAKNAKDMPAGLPHSLQVTYEEQRDRRALYFEAMQALPSEARQALREGMRTPENAAAFDLTPHPNWDIFRALNPGALSGYNTVVAQWWLVQDALEDVLLLLLDLFRTTPNDVDGALARWKSICKGRGWDLRDQVTAQQLFNPGQGKGQNSAKANSLSMGNVRSFWLLEYLKAVGFYEAALTKQIRATKDRKTWVLCPVDLDLNAHETVFGRFRRNMNVATGAVLADIMASLRYTSTLIRYAVEHQGGLLSLLSREAGPRQVVSGFQSAFYKSLGTSAATMNLPFIGLPGWLRIESTEDAAEALRFLNEHEAVVRQLDEGHGDEFAMLTTYRDWLSANDLEGFFRFAVSFSGYIISMRERGRRVRQFSQDNLRRLIMGSDPKLQPILDDPGFQRIANAIRQSTVVAQFRKQQGDRRYDVRYGLGQQLTRKAYSATEFISELADFIHKYNAENAQVMETRSGPYRSSIHTDDIDRVVRLVDTYGARTVCNLLVAYGYARSSRAAGEGDEPSIEEEGRLLDEEAEEESEA